MGASGGPSAWMVEGALGLLLSLQSVPSRARSCEGTKPQAESRLCSETAWLFEPQDRTSRLHRLGWQRAGLRHGQGGGQSSNGFKNEARVRGVPHLFL